VKNTELDIDAAGNVTEKPPKDKSRGKTGRIFFYNGGYFLELPGNRFEQLDVNSIKRQLIYDGMDIDHVSRGLKNWERAITLAERENNVAYAGPLAGHQAGLKCLRPVKKCWSLAGSPWLAHTPKLSPLFSTSFSASFWGLRSFNISCSG
jgi:hypothetical protein